MIVIALLIALFLFIKEGISIDHLKIGSIQIDQLYLKLDKKLILNINYITIPIEKDDASFANLKESLEQVHQILYYFQSIDIQKLHYKDNRYTLSFADHILYVTDDEYEIAVKNVKYIDDELHGDIDLFYLKKYDARLSGKLIYNDQNESLSLYGKAEYLDIKSDFAAIAHQKNLYYYIKTAHFTQLKPLIEHFKIKPNINAWITDNITAGAYRVEHLQGHGNIGADGIKIDPDTIEGNAVLEDVTIRFKEGVEPVMAKTMNLSFAHGVLSFDPQEPDWLGRTLVGSKVSITGLDTTPQPAVLKLDLRLDSILDDQIHKILHAYKINIPVVQNSGQMSSRLQIDVWLKDKTTEFTGDFNLTKGEVEISKVKLPVTGGRVQIKNNIVNLAGIELQDSWYKTDVNGNIYLEAKKADLILDIASLSLGSDKKSYFAMRQTKLPLKIDYSKDPIFAIPSAKTTFTVNAQKKSTVIEIADLELLKPWMKGLPITINGGNLKIMTEDFADFRFEGILERNECFLYRDDSACLTRIPISGTVGKDDITLYAFDKQFHYNARNAKVTLDRLNLDLEKFFETKKSALSGDLDEKIEIVGKNSILRYEKHKLLTDQYTIAVSSVSSFKFTGVLGNDKITLQKKGTKLEVRAIEISDAMAHPLIHFDGLQKGSYTIKMDSVTKDIIKGEVLIDGGVMSNFKAYNNLLAFINTIPALATLNSPGFSSKGFVIKQGKIDFTLNGDQLTMDSIVIEGKTALISGKGEIDLKSKDVKVDIAIQAAKSAGKIVGKLPVIGYILTGEDQSIMTVGVNITGTLDDPIVKSSPIKDALLLPFELIRRTLTAPAHIGDNLKDASKTP